MNIPTWLKPLWSLIAGAVKWRLHEIVDSIDERDVQRFKIELHTRIEKL